MKLGISFTPNHKTPDEWAAALKNLGLSAAVFPINSSADDATVRAYRDAAHQYGITIAEVGVWNSPVADDPAVRAQSLEYAKNQLALADQIGASCCVNVSGASGPLWYLGYRKDRTREGYEAIIKSIQEIIDDVKPTHTYYTIECMPIVPPTSPDEYLQMIKDVNREAFAVHLDAFNMLFTPDRYFFSGGFFRDCFKKLGPHIKSMHAKDVILTEDLTFCIKETSIGEGNSDYDAFLTGIEAISPDMPLIIEHKQTLEEYTAAISVVKEKAEKLGITLK